MRSVYSSLILMIASTVFSACAHDTSKQDVAQFVENRDLCDHLIGEIPDTPESDRAKEVAAGIDKYCTGADKQLKAMKKKYANDADVMAKLDGYEASIEGNTAKP